ncbi:MAG TPA: malic enzyme-like NAD(P)-binding protein [Planctomycetota bacterium]|nr:malic enzyme-like NAD(P)-binding protein [Planctomycetota bacterium]
MFHDVTLRVRMPHRAGTLAKIASEIGRSGAVIGDLQTIHTDAIYSLRDITVELEGADVATLCKAIEGAVPGSRVSLLPDRSMEFHEGGKLRTVPSRPVRTLSDMRLAYTPGVAGVCQKVANDDEALRRYTSVGKNVLVLSDGSRVLGLGDLGPRGVIPVLEGKSIFYSEFVGLNGLSFGIDVRDVGKVVELCRALRPNYSAIHLEDIAAPRCFELEARLQDELRVPVLHDDRHGTAVVAAAAVLSALRTLDLDLSQLVVGQVGLGAAGYTILELLIEMGPRGAIAYDPSPDAVVRAKALGADFAPTVKGVMEKADVVVAATGRAGLIHKDYVKKGQVVFALTNPRPEIRPALALAAGAALASEGAAINNVLAYPGLMKGAIDAHAVRFTPEMKIAAARALAQHASADDLLPSPFLPGLHLDVARAVEQAARAAAAPSPAAP